MKVLYLAVHDDRYPRNQLVRGAIMARGWNVDMVHRDISNGYYLGIKGMWPQVRALWNEPFDLVVLSELALQFAAPAKIIARHFGCPLWVDAFVGMYETNVEDWNEVAEGSIKARAYKFFDSVAYKLSSCVLIDTDSRAEHLRADGASDVVVVPVGVPGWVRICEASPLQARQEPLRILYYGNYIPLHGLDYVITALGFISDCSEIEVEFVGDGKLRQHVERRVRDELPPGVVSFIDPVEPEALVGYVCNSDVVLGTFGHSPKARSVIANKVWQGLAFGKPVITASTAGLQELSFLPAGQLIQVDDSDPRSLADALHGLASGPLRPGSVFPETANLLSEYVHTRLASIDERLAAIEGQSAAR